MIDLTQHKHAPRVMKLALLDDKMQIKKGEVIEYWRGKTWLDTPTGPRAAIFKVARDMMEIGKVSLVQYKYGPDDYGYRAEVR